MAGLSEGYVIPRLATVCVTPPLVCDVPYGEGGAQQGRGAHAEHHLSDGKDNGSLRHLRDEYKLIFSARCIYCKSFHHPDKYCFRLSTFLTMARGRGRLAAESDSDSTSGSGTGGEDYGDASSVEDQTQRTPGLSSRTTLALPSVRIFRHFTSLGRELTPTR